MEIVITSGAISEDIDTVRSVTNNATGELGCRIAEAFAHKYNDKIHITYLCERTAIRPHLTCVNVQFVHGIEQTIDTLHTILTTRSISAVIHSMAVSDYTVDNVTNTQLLAQNLFDKIHINPPLNLKEMELLLKDCIDQATFLNRKGKISSKMADMVLFLKKAPKILNMIKKY
ncbi:MAG TPA: phosphopantothenate--cysteine ligase, partial [Ruminococcaceae bacterium]|nr:phosphopantothenate--cysteine ligase [Oscillospiraceae bacterium]